jgi:hypothetical protein
MNLDFLDAAGRILAAVPVTPRPADDGRLSFAIAGPAVGLSSGQAVRVRVDGIDGLLADPLDVLEGHPL